VHTKYTTVNNSEPLRITTNYIEEITVPVSAVDEELFQPRRRVGRMDADHETRPRSVGLHRFEGMVPLHESLRSFSAGRPVSDPDAAVTARLRRRMKEGPEAHPPQGLLNAWL